MSHMSYLGSTWMAVCCVCKRFSWRLWQVVDPVRAVCQGKPRPELATPVTFLWGCRFTVWAGVKPFMQSVGVFFLFHVVIQLNEKAKLTFLIDSPKRTSYHSSLQRKKLTQFFSCLLPPEKTLCWVSGDEIKCLISISLHSIDFWIFIVGACALLCSAFKLYNNIHLAKSNNYLNILRWMMASCEKR